MSIRFFFILMLWNIASISLYILLIGTAMPTWLCIINGVLGVIIGRLLSPAEDE